LVSIVFLAVTILAVGQISLAVLSEEEARKLFEELRCVTCHVEGGIADSWEEIIHEIEEEWPAEYPTIDDAARDTEYMGQKIFRDFSHLMQVMGQNVGAPEDKIKQLEEFFRKLFEEGKKAVKEEVEEKPAEQPQPFGDLGLVVAIAVAIIVIVALAVYAVTRKR
jgi:hypothetical protein